MNTIYEDIIKSLKIKKTIEPQEIRKNEYLSKIVDLINQLINTIHQEEKSNDKAEKEKIKTKKQILINKIKTIIQNLNEEFHLRLDDIISNEKINSKELQFALDLLYENTELERQLEKIKEYREKQGTINSIKNTLYELKEQKRIIIESFDEIRDITNLRNKEVMTIVLSKFNPKNKKTIEEKRQEIITALIKTQKQFHEQLKIDCTSELEKLKQIKENMNTVKMTEKNRHNIKKQIIHNFEKIENKISSTLNKNTNKQTELRASIEIPQQQLSKILYGDNKNYTFIMMQASFKNNKDKKETLIAKTILILKLINIIENNEITVLDELEERKKTM